MIRICTGSRLHFGLFSLPSESAGAWLNHEGEATIPRRHFGGAGLMIDRPGIELTLAQADEWSAEGPLAERALRFAQTFCAALGVTDCLAIRIEHAAPEHAGLGTGTQLGLAVVRAIAELKQLPIRDASLLAMRIGRGQRSALGAHGFEKGGFLVEGGKTSIADISPLLFRRDFPDNWRVLLVTPRDLVGIHGQREREAFSDLTKKPPDDQTTERLCRLVLLGMLPALIERDLANFGEALTEFNQRVGTMFERAQGGAYAHPRVDAIVRALRRFGAHGVGQTSWGPTIFAIVLAQQAEFMRGRLVEQRIVGDSEVLLASGLNHGARISGD